MTSPPMAVEEPSGSEGERAQPVAVACEQPVRGRWSHWRSSYSRSYGESVQRQKVTQNNDSTTLVWSSHRLETGLAFRRENCAAAAGIAARQRAARPRRGAPKRKRGRAGVHRLARRARRQPLLGGGGDGDQRGGEGGGDAEGRAVAEGPPEEHAHPHACGAGPG